MKINMSKVALFSPIKGAASETFIRAHIEKLPFEIVDRYGSKWGICDAKDLLIWPIGRIFGKVIRYFRSASEKSFFAYMLARHLRHYGVQAVLAEYGPIGAYLVEGCKRAGIPLFVHFHGYDASVRSVLAEHNEAYQEMFAYASGVVAVSRIMSSKLLALGVPANKLYTNPCGVDPTLFFGGRPEESPPIFVGVGRFVEKKAPFLTILAFSKVHGAIPESRLIMVGEGQLLGPCKQLAKALHLQKEIDFLGAQPSSAVRTLMRNCRAFVQHSLQADDGDCEGTPVAVIEAQMTGVPVIATRHAGIPDVVVDGETGFIVEEGDTDGMADRMLQLAKSQALAGRLGRAGQKRAVEHFTLERHLNSLAEMIDEGIAEAQTT